jgi:amino acid adenylation domain-containing protein
VGPDVPVAICMERSPALLVGLLAILKAGGAYVPLDADQPRERLAFQLQDSEATLLLTQQTLFGRLPVTACPRLCLDRDQAEIAKHPTDDPTGVGNPRQLAYIIYTSGSTGAPKGVAIRQQGVLRLVVRPNYVSITAGDTVAQVSNVAFDAGTFEIWGALLNGARLIILPREVALSPRLLVHALRTHRVTCLFLTTAVFHEVSREIPAAFSSLRSLLFGGEACNPDRVNAVMQAGAPEHLIHVYGPTEATTFATFHVVRERQERGRVPIGRPISGTEVLLLDARGALVPPGVIGEIHIGGLGVAAGYLGRPAETQARFIQHPFASNSGARLFRTGDLARQRPDGAIEFVGRNDDQVKIRGFRVEPAEIAAVLSSHPGIRACHVMLRRQPTGENGLTAYVVLGDRSDPGLSSAALRRFLSERLPTYMIPATFVVCETLPLTVNGKVDFRALPEPVAGDIPALGGDVAPRDAIEQSMCRVWGEVLGIERVGLDANFFEIGGHSLLAAKLFARMDEEFGRSLALGVLYTAPTVRLLASHYRDAAGAVDASARALVSLHSGGTRPPLYLLPGVFGNVVGYADFVRELGPDQPIYGLQSVGLDGRAAPYDSVEVMARHYVAEVFGHQPRGPYAIIGACFGATIAYEMARQIMAAGETISFLGLVAPTTREGDELGERLLHAPRLVRRAAALGDLAQQRLRGYLSEMRSLGLSERLMYVPRKLRSLMASLMRTHGLKGTARELNQLEVYRANLRALDRYLRYPLEGRIAAIEIFETADTASPGRRSPNDWESDCPVVPQWHFLPGKDSGQMLMGENARVIASLLSERLRLAFNLSFNDSGAPVLESNRRPGQ